MFGAELRRIREAAGKSTREIGTYTSGYISQVERGLETPSAELVEEYARLGGDRAHLLMTLDDLKQQGEERKRQDRLARRGALPDTASLTPDADFMELRRGYRIDLMDDFYEIRPNRVLGRTTHLVRVQALTPHTRYFVLSYGYEVDQRPGVLQVEPTSACRVARIEETPTGSINFVLEFDRSHPVEPDRFEFFYRILVNSNIPTKPMLRSGSRSGVGRCVRRVQFSTDDLPEQAWWFREPELLATDKEPSQDRIFPPNTAGSYAQEFVGVYREFYGIAWRWRE